MNCVNHLDKIGKTLFFKPSLSHEEVAAVVKGLALGTETDNLWSPLDGMAFDENLSHVVLYMG